MNEKTLAQLIEMHVKELERVFEQVCEIFPSETARETFIKVMQSELDDEVIRINGIRPSDVPNTSKGAWFIARQQMIKKLKEAHNEQK